MDTEQHYCSNQDSQKFYIHPHLSVTEFIIHLCVQNKKNTVLKSGSLDPDPMFHSPNPMVSSLDPDLIFGSLNPDPISFLDLDLKFGCLVPDSDHWISSHDWMDPNIHFHCSKYGYRIRIKIEKIPSAEGIPGTG